MGETPVHTPKLVSMAPARIEQDVPIELELCQKGLEHEDNAVTSVESGGDW